MKETNRFKGLDLLDRVFEKLWTEVCNIVQEAVTKTIPKKKECKKTKWFSEEASQIAEGQRKVKGKGERERYTQLKVEFQGITKRDKAFLNEQYGKNRMGKTRDLFKKSRAIKGTFHARMGMIKDRNGKDTAEAEEIKKRWQENTKEIYQKVSMTQITTMVWLTNCILEGKVKWALGSFTTNKASEGDRIPAELFQILKDDAIKALHSISQQILENISGYRTGKGQLSNLKEGQCQRMFKLPGNYIHFTC